jgi:hypothetical protein
VAAYYHPEGPRFQGQHGSVRLTDGQLVMEFESRAGKHYVIERCDDLSGPVWQQVGFVEGTGWGCLFKMPHMEYPQVYLRVREVHGLIQ